LWEILVQENLVDWNDDGGGDDGYDVYIVRGFW